MMRSHRNRVIAAALAGAGFAAVSLAAQPAMAADSMVVRDFVLSHAIDQREPVDETAFFHVKDGRAFAFARIRNTGAPATVSFVWYYDETSYAAVPVNVGTSPGWRTWSAVKLRPGNWRVELVGAQGDVLTQRAFHVGHEPAASTPIATMEEAPQYMRRGDVDVPFDAIDQGQQPASFAYPAR
jgi:hypothetical protein